MPSSPDLLGMADVQSSPVRAANPGAEQGDDGSAPPQPFSQEPSEEWWQWLFWNDRKCFARKQIVLCNTWCGHPRVFFAVILVVSDYVQLGCADWTPPLAVSAHLVHSWSAFGQSNPAKPLLPWKQIWVSGENSKIFFKSSLSAEPTPWHPQLSMAGIGTSSLRAELSLLQKAFCAKWFSLSICGFIRTLPTPLLGARTWWQQMQACWQKACFSLHLLQTLQKTFLVQTPPAKNY